MIIIQDERAKGMSHIGKCENCGQTVLCRKVKAYDVVHRGNRGYYLICFSCFGPRIFWKKNEGGIIYESPAE